jgi:hypothetical protein
VHLVCVEEEESVWVGVFNVPSLSPTATEDSFLITKIRIIEVPLPRLECPSSMFPKGKFSEKYVVVCASFLPVAGRILFSISHIINYF